MKKDRCPIDSIPATWDLCGPCHMLGSCHEGAMQQPDPGLEEREQRAFEKMGVLPIEVQEDLDRQNYPDD